MPHAALNRWCSQLTFGTRVLKLKWLLLINRLIRRQNLCSIFVYFLLSKVTCNSFWGGIKISHQRLTTQNQLCHHYQPNPVSTCIYHEDELMGLQIRRVLHFIHHIQLLFTVSPGRQQTTWASPAGSGTVIWGTVAGKRRLAYTETGTPPKPPRGPWGPGSECPGKSPPCAPWWCWTERFAKQDPTLHQLRKSM